eukprot:GHVU01190652.1.p1 GENE.GHVU01190652.1~~GHVU01190652.1.p1  ORF type:complete len:264 (+),score=37.54 GHVU01190652.1:206-997(+)
MRRRLIVAAAATAAAVVLAVAVLLHLSTTAANRALRSASGKPRKTLETGDTTGPPQSRSGTRRQAAAAAAAEERRAATELGESAGGLEALLRAGGRHGDALALFGAAWSLETRYAQQALVYVEQHFAALNVTDLPIYEVDCEASRAGTRLCDFAGVDRYPTLLYAGQINFHQLPPPLQHCVRYEGSYVMAEQIRDWVRLMRFLSRMGVRWQRAVTTATRGLTAAVHLHVHDSPNASWGSRRGLGARDFRYKRRFFKKYSSPLV